ncbi:hypothetical protein SAMN02910297_00955 [Methanobrevibacter olleyae]|uniref:Uncharacterized protein n=1 Tax=Methanobrevibacter olleyae TaxID=294671 RepID=A0A1I4HX20_METOL|nr:hypothetical protein [Methanobrevibacter olleyae]SFL46293.1 hypothetical protein SAMN02910297_00955 [Methanobrevibacter olleyae]
MGEFCFSFLENRFRDIYLDCARMDKNLIEGDGVEAILIAGRIAEKITKSIFTFEGIKDDENNQFKRIEKLNNANILPNNIKNDFSKLRRLRNDVYHNTLNSDGAGGIKRINSQPNRQYMQNLGLRDYKTGFNEIKGYSSSNGYDNSSSNDLINLNDDSKSENKENKSNPLLSKDNSNDISGEIQAASEAHRLIFNICVWFYINYSGDKDFIRPKYKLSRRTQDADFLIRLKSAINDGDDFKRLRQSSPNNEIIQILNELYIPEVVKERDDDSVYRINNQEIKIRNPGVPYSKCLGISYDDNLFMWKAEHGGKELGYYQSSKEAYEAREVYINSVPMPKKVNGVYSKARGISFSKIQKLWSMNVKGQIISFHGSENEAIKARKDYLKANGLVDVKVNGGFKTITLDELDKLRAKAKENKSKQVKSINSKSSIKDEIYKKSKKNSIKLNPSNDFISKNNKLNPSNDSISKNNKLNPSNDSISKNNKLNYGNEFKNENKNKISVQDGNKLSSSKNNKKVKVSGGNRVSKTNSKKSKRDETTINKKKSSKYEGVLYEEGLFMWSAEVDGKHLGLFSSEKEAHEKREEYIKNRF